MLEDDDKDEVAVVAPVITLRATVDNETKTQVVQMREPTYIERKLAKKKTIENKGSALGYVLHTLANQAKLEVDHPLIKNLEASDFRKAKRYLDSLANVKPPPNTIETVLSFEPFPSATDLNKMYSEIILRRPSIFEIDRILGNCTQNGIVDYDKAALEFITTHSNLPKSAINNLPVSVFDKAVLYYIYFLDELMTEPNEKSSTPSFESDED